MSTTTTHHHIPEPVTCKSWCEYQDGHKGASSAGDQVCCSDEVTVVASLYPAVTMIPGNRIEPEHFGVYGEYDHEERVTSVFLGRGDLAGLSMTPVEARQVAAALIAAADMIE